MNKLITLLVVLLLICQSTVGQPYFNRMVKATTLFKSVVATDTGYIAVGSGFKDLYRTSYIYACNEKGDSLWLKHFASSPPEASGAKKIIPDGFGFYVAGTIRDTADVTPWDFYLSYFTPKGEQVWLKRYGEPETTEFLEDAILTSSSDIVMVGIKRTASGDRDAWYIIKTDADGNLLWEKKIDGIENENGCRSIIETQEGDYVLVGEQEVAPKSYDLWMIKLNPNGDILWDTTYGGEFTEFSPEVNITPNGNIGIAFDFLQSEKSASRAIKYLEIDRFTAEIIRDIPILNFKEGSVLTKPLYDEHGNITIAGNFVPEFDLIGLVIKFTPTGEIIWSREYTNNGDLPHYIYDLQPAKDEGFVFCGAGYPEDHAGGYNQGWVARLDCKGADSLTYYFPEQDCDDISGIHEYPKAKEQSQLSLYPNPTSNYLHISSKDISIKNINIKNTLGQVVFHNKLNGEQLFTLDIQNWESGIYLIQVESSTGKIFRKNFVVH